MGKEIQSTSDRERKEYVLTYPAYIPQRSTCSDEEKAAKDEEYRHAVERAKSRAKWSNLTREATLINRWFNSNKLGLDAQTCPTISDKTVGAIECHLNSITPEAVEEINRRISECGFCELYFKYDTADSEDTITTNPHAYIIKLDNRTCRMRISLSDKTEKWFKLHKRCQIDIKPTVFGNVPPYVYILGHRVYDTSVPVVINPLNNLAYGERYAKEINKIIREESSARCTLSQNNQQTFRLKAKVDRLRKRKCEETDFETIEALAEDITMYEGRLTRLEEENEQLKNIQRDCAARLRRIHEAYRDEAKMKETIVFDEIF